MTKATKAILLNNYDEYFNKPCNAGLGTIYNDWSDEKQRAYDRIKTKLNLEFEYYDLRCTHGNSFCFNCAAMVEDRDGKRYFIVFTRNYMYMCNTNNNYELIDENGTIFYS